MYDPGSPIAQQMTQNWGATCLQFSKLYTEKYCRFMIVFLSALRQKKQQYTTQHLTFRNNIKIIEVVYIL